MVLNNYLEKIANNLILSLEENLEIEASLKILKTKIENNFSGLNEHFCFGSYKRKTNLPKTLDKESDIDYLLVFPYDKELDQYLIVNQLIEFVNNNFSSENIIRTYPTCIIKINGIRFELIPAYRKEKYYINYKIPSSSINNNEWIEATPNTYNEYLIQFDSSHNYNIIPVIRILKFWNTLNHYPYIPYLLEKSIMFMDFPQLENLVDYFFYAVEHLNLENVDKSNHVLINEFKKIINEIKNEEDEEVALFKLSSIIPYI